MNTDISDRAWAALYRHWYEPEPEPLPLALVAVVALPALACIAGGLVMAWIRSGLPPVGG